MLLLRKWESLLKLQMKQGSFGILVQDEITYQKCYLEILWMFKATWCFIFLFSYATYNSVSFLILHLKKSFLLLRNACKQASDILSVEALYTGAKHYSGFHGYCDVFDLSEPTNICPIGQFTWLGLFWFFCFSHHYTHTPFVFLFQLPIKIEVYGEMHSLAHAHAWANSTEK
jgi:hypothetical protein